MIVCVPVAPDGSGVVGPGWGRAPVVAVSRVEDGVIASWTEHPVAWDVARELGHEGGHHARIARFLMDQGVQVVVAGHMGEPMQQMLDLMGISVRLGVSGSVRAAALEAQVG